MANVALPDLVSREIDHFGQLNFRDTPVGQGERKVLLKINFQFEADLEMSLKAKSSPNKLLVPNTHTNTLAQVEIELKLWPQI